LVSPEVCWPDLVQTIETLIGATVGGSAVNTARSASAWIIILQPLQKCMKNIFSRIVFALGCNHRINSSGHSAIRRFTSHVWFGRSRSG
jgi:hypothetical protein